MKRNLHVGDCGLILNASIEFLTGSQGPGKQNVLFWIRFWKGKLIVTLGGGQAKSNKNSFWLPELTNGNVVPRVH